MKGAVVVLIAALCAIMELSCKTQTDVLFNQGGQYNRDVQVIFNRSCNTTVCHGSLNSSSDSLLLTSYQNVLLGSKFGNIVVPYIPEHSTLFQVINNDTNLSDIAIFAPVHLDSTIILQPGDRDTIYNWILNGCRADDGTVPYTANPSGVMYVANQAEDLIAIVDVASNQVLRYARTNATNSLTVPSNFPTNVAVDQKQEYFYATMSGSNQLFQYDCTTLQPIHQTPVGPYPSGLILSFGGDTAFVTTCDSVGKIFRSVEVVSTNSMAVVDTISDPRMIAPCGIRMSSDGTYLYTANMYSDNISQISTSTLQVVAVYPLASDVPAIPPANYIPKYQPVQVALTAVNSGQSLMYVSCYGTNEVRVFDYSANVFDTPIPVGRGPMQLRISPDGRFVFVPNRLDSSVSVIITINNSIYKTIKNVGVQPHAVEFTPDGKFAYVTCESQYGNAGHNLLAGPRRPGTTAVIDMSTLQVVPIRDAQAIEMGAMPSGITASGGAN